MPPNFDYFKLYQDLQPFVKKEAEDAADRMYEDKATLFGVAEVPFHTHNVVDSAQVSFPNLANRSRYFLYRVVANATDTSTGLIGGNLVMPFGGNFTLAGATVDTAGVTGTMVVNVLLNGSTIFSSASNRINIATGATTSRTNANQPMFLTNNFNLGDILTFNVVTVQTTPAKGLTIFLRVNESTP